MGLHSIIFHTKHFEQKLVLTGCTHITMRLDPLSTKISFEKSNFLIFCAFFRIFHVCDFLSMFYFTDQLENAGIQFLDSMQKLKYVSDIFYKVSILTLIFVHLWVPGSITFAFT